MRIKRKYVSSTIIIALGLWLFYSFSFVDVPLLCVTGQNSPWYDLDEQMFDDIAKGKKTFIVIKSWQRKLKQSGLTAGDQLIADDLIELRTFLRDKPDAIACLPWYQVEPEFRTLRYYGVYFWDAEYYPIVRCFSWGWLPKYRRKDIKNITFGGTVTLGRDVGNVIERTNDVNYPWQKIAKVLRKADLTVVNLESPLVYNYIRPRTQNLIYGKAAHARGLISAGVSAVVLTGAHLGDAGLNGLRDTLDVLDKLNIKHIGIGSTAEDVYLPYFFKLENLTIALFPGVQSKAVYKETDLRGVEHTYYAAADPAYLLHSAENTTADAIFVLGKVNSARKNIFSVTDLGGLVFDQNSTGRREGRIKRYFFYKKRLVAIDELPVFLGDRWYTELK